MWPGLPGVIDGAFKNMLYFSLGLLFSQLLLTRSQEYSNGRLLLASLLCFSIMSLLLLVGITPEHPLRFITAILGTTALVAVCLASGSIRFLQPIAFLGSISLEIFVAHTIGSACIRIVLKKVFGIVDPYVHLSLGIAAAIIFPVVLVAFCNKFRIPFLFRYPSRSGERQPRAAVTPSPT
jgi:peptidoglycan/LPS O-acetylase OafA/YrhL